MSFTHYTGEMTTVQRILENGFVWVDNKRNLISDLLPNRDFIEREPQQFGMISFTELPPERAEGPRLEFGNFGIVVSREWAASHNIQKVWYVAGEGPIFEALRWLFQFAYEDLVKKSMQREEEVSHMAFTNRVRAEIAGGRLYSKLLQLYEYMEPIENSYQHEWRIVHPMPLYGYKNTKQEIIENVSPPKGWAKHVHVLTLTTDDIVGFVCPLNELGAFQELLNSPFQEKPIYSIKA